jgi:hypothetical protein
VYLVLLPVLRLFIAVVRGGVVVGVHILNFVLAIYGFLHLVLFTFTLLLITKFIITYPPLPSIPLLVLITFEVVPYVLIAPTLLVPIQFYRTGYDMQLEVLFVSALSFANEH